MADVIYARSKGQRHSLRVDGTSYEFRRGDEVLRRGVKEDIVISTPNSDDDLAFQALIFATWDINDFPVEC